jgi:hypothetical protein
MQTEAAATQQPSLAHIAANPDALANMTDDQIEALANTPAPAIDESASATAGEKTGSETPAAASQDATAAATAETSAAEAPAAAETKGGIQAKDGTHVIPYSVLEREREARTRAEAMLQAQADEIDRLKAGGKQAEGEQSAVTLSADDLAQLDQDLPDVAKAIRAQQATIEALAVTVKTLKQDQEVQTTLRQQSVKDETESAILANPDLSAWRDAAFNEQAPDPLMWNRAADLDVVLREDPVWRDRPLNERFAKVAETIKTLYGDTPSAAKPAAETTASQTDATLKAKADAALAGAAKADALPLSSSAIPGGAAPAVDELAGMLDKSGAQLTAEFMAMTPEQIDAKLNRLR